MLLSIVDLEDAVVLDLFAGSGSFGLECLSRGAAQVTFVEQDRRAAEVIRSNVDTLGFGDKADVRQSSVSTVLAGFSSRVGDGAADPSSRVDLAFCDPPYADDVWAELLPTVPADVLVGHASHPVELTDEWTELKRRSYGRAQIVIAERR